MQQFRFTDGVFSPIGLTAFVCLVMLGGVIGYRAYTAANPSVAETETAAPDETILPSDWQTELAALGLTTDEETGQLDDLSLIGPVIATELLRAYEDLAASGSYTKDDLRAAAESIADKVRVGVTFTPYKKSAFATTDDTSKARVIAYADEMMQVLAPLNSIPEAEYVTYARYAETGDAAYLAKLMAVSDTYRTVAKAGADVEVPADAAEYHLNILNALLEFAEVLEGLSTHGEDPIASVALLRTYNEAEAGIVQSYNEMRGYYDAKTI